MNNLTIYTESNPNPNSLKFVVNSMLVDEGIVKDYANVQSTIDSPLAKKLFDFPFVKRVFIMNNFITITKEEKNSWSEIKMELSGFIKKYIEEGNDIIKISSAPAPKKFISKTTNIDNQIKQILDEYIKPAVEQDGGAINFESFNDGKVLVSLKGSCSGCPSSTITLKSGIENLLKRFIPEVKEVIAEEL